MGDGIFMIILWVKKEPPHFSGIVDVELFYMEPLTLLFFQTNEGSF